MKKLLFLLMLLLVAIPKTVLCANVVAPHDYTKEYNLVGIYNPTNHTIQDENGNVWKIRLPFSKEKFCSILLNGNGTQEEKDNSLLEVSIKTFN